MVVSADRYGYSAYPSANNEPLYQSEVVTFCWEITLIISVNPLNLSVNLG